MRVYTEVGVQVEGNIDLGRSYVSHARTLLGVMKSFNNGLAVQHWNRELPDGTKIFMSSIHGNDRVRIIAPGGEGSVPSQVYIDFHMYIPKPEAVTPWVDSTIDSVIYDPTQPLLLQSAEFGYQEQRDSQEWTMPTPGTILDETVFINTARLDDSTDKSDPSMDLPCSMYTTSDTGEVVAFTGVYSYYDQQNLTRAMSPNWAEKAGYISYRGMHFKFYDDIIHDARVHGGKLFFASSSRSGYGIDLWYFPLSSYNSSGPNTPLWINNADSGWVCSETPLYTDYSSPVAAAYSLDCTEVTFLFTGATTEDDYVKTRRITLRDQLIYTVQIESNVDGSFDDTGAGGVYGARGAVEEVLPARGINRVKDITKALTIDTSSGQLMPWSVLGTDSGEFQFVWNPSFFATTVLNIVPSGRVWIKVVDPTNVSDVPAQVSVYTWTISEVGGTSKSFNPTGGSYTFSGVTYAFTPSSSMGAYLLANPYEYTRMVWDVQVSGLDDGVPFSFSSSAGTNLRHVQAGVYARTVIGRVTQEVYYYGSGEHLFKPVYLEKDIGTMLKGSLQWIRHKGLGGSTVTSDSNLIDVTGSINGFSGMGPSGDPSGIFEDMAETFNSTSYRSSSVVSVDVTEDFSLDLYLGHMKFSKTHNDASLLGTEDFSGVVEYHDKSLPHPTTGDYYSYRVVDNKYGIGPGAAFNNAGPYNQYLFSPMNPQESLGSWSGVTEIYEHTDTYPPLTTHQTESRISSVKTRYTHEHFTRLGDPALGPLDLPNDVLLSSYTYTGTAGTAQPILWGCFESAAQLGSYAETTSEFNISFDGYEPHYGIIHPIAPGINIYAGNLNSLLKLGYGFVEEDPSAKTNYIYAVDSTSGEVLASLDSLYTDYAILDLEPFDPDENYRYHVLMPGINTLGPGAL